jgi:hypothetical protein
MFVGAIDAKEGAIRRRLYVIVLRTGGSVANRRRRPWQGLIPAPHLIENVSSVGELLHAGALKGQVARLLHSHKD